MSNGKPGDNPLTDFLLHGSHPFPEDIEDLLRRIEKIGRAYETMAARRELAILVA
jgi:hypothetical protein